MPTISADMSTALNLAPSTVDGDTIGVELLDQLGLQAPPPADPNGSLALVPGGDVYGDFVPQLLSELEDVLAAGTTPNESAVEALAGRVLADFDIRQLVAIKRELGWAQETSTEVVATDRTGQVRSIIANLLAPAVVSLLQQWQGRGLLSAVQPLPPSAPRTRSTRRPVLP